MTYQDLNVAADKAARDEMVSKTGGRLVVPVVEVDGEVVVGYDENWLKQKLGV